MGTAVGSLCLAAVITAYPCGTSSPEPFQTAAPQTPGVSHDLPRRSPSGRRRAPPSSLHRSYKSYKSYASATPTHPAYHRCHHVARHTPAVNLPPSHARQRHRKPPGYHMTCHGVARQGEDGRPHHCLIGLISLISLMQASRHRAFAYPRSHQIFVKLLIQDLKNHLSYGIFLKCNISLLRENYIRSMFNGCHHLQNRC